jgi:hypothetical protein
MHPCLYCYQGKAIILLASCFLSCVSLVGASTILYHVCSTLQLTSCILSGRCVLTCVANKDQCTQRVTRFSLYLICKVMTCLWKFLFAYTRSGGSRSESCCERNSNLWAACLGLESYCCLNRLNDYMLLVWLVAFLFLSFLYISLISRVLPSGFLHITCCIRYIKNNDNSKSFVFWLLVDGDAVFIQTHRIPFGVLVLVTSFHTHKP